jgi:hypothetical protein
MRLDDAVQTDGATRIAAALSGRLRVAGGELLGTGAVAAEVVNSGGTVRPGGLVFTGRFLQGSGGRLVLAVGDVLRGADIALGGLLRVEGSDATLQPGARIEVVRATGSRSGTFAAVETVPARRLGVEYGPSVVALVVEPPETEAPTDQPPTDQPPSSSPPSSSSSSPGLKAVRPAGATCIRSGRIRLRYLRCA